MRVTVFLLLSTIFFNATAKQESSCDSQLLVSSWKNNNVKIYDGCDYHFIKDLDTKGTIKGPQSIFQDHQGDVIVISEANHQVIKYDGKTLDEKAIVISAGQIESPISAVLDGEFHVLIHSYAENSIHRYDMRNWQRIETILAKGNNHVKGIDLGPNFGPDGMLYVPGYDSNNIIKINPETKAVTEFISADLGINRPRTILWYDGHAYVSAWGNANIFQLNKAGQITRIMFPTVTGASALLMDGPDHMLISSDRKNSVYRYGLKDGSVEALIKEDKKHLDASTYVYRLNK